MPTQYLHKGRIHQKLLRTQGRRRLLRFPLFSRTLAWLSDSFLLPLVYERFVPRPLRYCECIHCTYQSSNVRITRSGTSPPAASTDAPPVRRECSANSSGLRPDCGTQRSHSLAISPCSHSISTTISRSTSNVIVARVLCAYSRDDGGRVQ